MIPFFSASAEAREARDWRWRWELAGGLRVWKRGNRGSGLWFTGVLAATASFPRAVLTRGGGLVCRVTHQCVFVRMGGEGSVEKGGKHSGTKSSALNADAVAARKIVPGFPS